MTKEEIKELIRKEFDSRPHPNVKDDFDFIWDIHEKWFPFSNEDYEPKEYSHIIKIIELNDVITKDDFLNKIKELPDNCRLYFGTDDDGDNYCNVSILKEDDMSMLIFKLYDSLHRWACMSNYALYKRIYLLEKENEELKNKLTSGI